ncbi:MAG: heme biosynthesis protein HemY [Paracoccaceae bacterium]
MLWSIVKISVFIALAAALAYVVGMLGETPGGVRIAFAGREISLTPIEFVLALFVGFILFWIALKIAGLLTATLRFLAGDDSALSRYFDRHRQRKGFTALTEGMIALAAGEGKIARAKAARAEKLLRRPELTRLLSAQAAELTGDRAAAQAHYREMLKDEKTRFVGIRGVLKQKLDEGDTETALKLAERAFALRPRNKGIVDTLFGLQTDRKDWSGARGTLQAMIRNKTLPKDVGTRRDAVLSLADAQKALDAGEADIAFNAAVQANRLAPTLVPAAALAARLQAGKGNKRAAQKLLVKAWSVNPHPDLAASFAAIEPEETPEARRKRFEALIRINPDHPESRLLGAELALAAEDFPGARKALGKLAEEAPTTRSLAIMAAIEKGSGATEAVVRGWLAKALEAPRGERWICRSCNHIHGRWQPVCENCGAFDTLDWSAPPAGAEDRQPASSMLPLIVGALASDTAEPEPGDVEDSLPGEDRTPAGEPHQPPADFVEDAEEVK